MLDGYSQPLLITEPYSNLVNVITWPAQIY